jgi:hypothetical protein
VVEAAGVLSLGRVAAAAAWEAVAVAAAAAWEAVVAAAEWEAVAAAAEWEAVAAEWEKVGWEDRRISRRLTDRHLPPSREARRHNRRGASVVHPPYLVAQYYER